MKLAYVLYRMYDVLEESKSVVGNHKLSKSHFDCLPEKKNKTIHLRDPHWQKSPRVARVSSLSKNVVLNAFNASNFKEKEKPPECQTITIYVYIYVSVCMCLCVYAAL